MTHRVRFSRLLLLPACALAALLAAAPGFAPRVYADGIKVSAGESIESPVNTTDFIYIRGGDEGKASANLKQTQDITVAKIVEVYGGDGRNGSPGNAGMFWADDITVTVRNADLNILTFTLKSGGTDGSSKGGNALFRGKGLDASSITLEKNSGLLTFSVQTLDVTAGNTTLSLTNTTANTDSNGGAGVYIGTARLGDGTLTVRGGAGGESGGAYIDTLALRGSGLFDDTANPINLGRLSIDGGTLNNANWSGLIDHAYDATPGIAVETGGVTVDLGQGEDKVLNRDLTAGTTPGGGLTKTGIGTLTLSGVNTYGGATTIKAGMLKGNIANDTDLSIAAGAAYDGDGKARSLNALNGEGMLSYTDGLTVQSGDFGGLINATNTGGLTKTGDGTLTLTGANTYSGGTTISAGTLVLSNADGTGTGAVTVGGRMRAASPTPPTLELAFAGTYANIIHGSGDVTANPGDGHILTLSGTTTYTGMTTVRSGTLALGGDLASNRLTLNGGTTFDRGNFHHSLDNGLLNIDGSNGQSATYQGDLSARNATLNFIASTNPGGPLLHVSGDANISGSAYNVGLSGGTSLVTGSTLILLQSDGALAADGLRQGSGILMIGATVAHDLTGSVSAEVDPVAGTVTATVPRGHATAQAQALSEGFLGGLALNLQGADLAAGRGMESALRASSGTDESAGGHGFAGFGALSGGSLRYNTGSHVDMNSLSLLTGLARGVDLPPGRLTLGAFFEYGYGSCDTHNSFAHAASVQGDGDARYVGGGVLGRMDFAPFGSGGGSSRFYAEAGGRLGRAHTTYDSADLRDAMGRKAEYDSASLYYGLHAGLGYVRTIHAAASLDLYGKYFWTRQEGDRTGLSTGEQLRFDDIDSSRLRLGGRLAWAVNERVAPYVGAAWEHEFDGRARATTNGLAIDAPALRGDSGLAELGLALTPSAALPLTVDLGVRGYTGKREGVSGSMQLKWTF